MKRQIRVGDSKYGTFDHILTPCPHYPHKSPNFALQIVVFSSKHTVPVIIDAHCAKFLHNLGTGSSLPKQLSGPKLMGSGLGEHVNICDPLFISATVEAGNFKFGIQLGHGE